MTQKQLIVEYIEEFGFIIPARMGERSYKGGFFGSETSKRCRELRADGMLRSEPDGKFEKFYLTEKKLHYGHYENTPLTEGARRFLEQWTVKPKEVIRENTLF